MRNLAAGAALDRGHRRRRAPSARSRSRSSTSRTRNAFGKPIGSFQANRFALADAGDRDRGRRASTSTAASTAHVAGELTPPRPPAPSCWTTELQCQVVDRCLQLHGGYGYMEEYEIARMWRDARVQRIYGGTSEIMKEIVGRSLGL